MGSAESEYAYLVDDAGRLAHPLSAGSTTIGRDASNVVVVRDPTASRFHAEVRRSVSGFAIQSIGATGTLLNGRAVDQPTVLNEGDVLEIAFTRFRFTQQAPTGGISVAGPHSTRNDETGKRPTLETTERVVVDEDNPAGRDTRRLQILVGLGLVLAGVLWWTLGRR